MDAPTRLGPAGFPPPVGPPLCSRRAAHADPIILDDSKAIRRDLVEEEERRAKLRLWAGLPAGAQPDLFGLPSPARDEIDAEAEGYQAGLRGDDPKPGDHISPNYHQAFMTGWHKAQERRAMALGGVPANDLTDAEVKGAA